MKKRLQTISKRILNSNDTKAVTVLPIVAENSYKMNGKARAVENLKDTLELLT